MNTDTREQWTKDCTFQPLPPDAPRGTEVFFSERERNGKTAYCLIPFTGKAQKPEMNLYGYYRSPEARQAALDNWLTNITASAQAKQARREARRAAVCPFAVGDILSGSWGYDQTNIEYYRILAQRGRRVTLRELEHETIAGSEGFMCATVKPGEEFGPEISRLAQTYDGRGWYVKLHESCDLHPWDGRPDYESHYA